MEDKQGYLTDRDSVGVAALHVSSWFDMAGEALEERAIFQKNATNARARDGQYAIISPTTHCLSERANSETMAGGRINQKKLSFDSFPSSIPPNWNLRGSF